MAASRIVMLSWAQETESAIKLTIMEISLFTGYVDDVRNNSTSIRLGMRYSEITLKWDWSEIHYQEDLMLRKGGETRHERQTRLLIPVLNSINVDLTFTAEIPEQFDSKRLPTLDFVLWQEAGGIINHHYYQKPMRTPLVIMKRSALGQQQKV